MLRFATATVRPQGIQPEIVLALVMVESVFAAFKQDCVITSLTDGEHTKAARHRQGLAVDLRSTTTPEDMKPYLLEGLREALPYYEVSLTDLGGPNEHFHIEYDYTGAS